jgi:hypothetical protein
MPLIFAGVVALSCLLIALAGVVALMVVPFVLVVGVGLIVRHLLRRGGRSSPP